MSSTYVDLIEERQAIIQALLELECIPAGMELFVATDQDQWNLIKGVIDLSDYYLLIIGARYGHVTDENISYTEKEYNYALEVNKPIIAFVHANPDDVPQGVTDKDAEKAKMLAAFRERVRNGSDGKRRNVGEFRTADELAAKVSRAMSIAMRKYPGIGWVRGDQAMTIETRQEIISLKSKLTELESEKLAVQTALVEDVEELAQGDDKITLKLMVTDTVANRTIVPEITITWDTIFREIAPLMMDEESESVIRNRLSRYLLADAPMDDQDRKSVNTMIHISCDTTDTSWDYVSVQMRALGLVEAGKKKRPINAQDKYLVLTEKGKRHLVKLGAIRKGVDPYRFGGDALSRP
ncbi:DUF4062 domain-containing protein [Mycobacterium kubicae]|uniref:DUF4062 domain-containing protein n=1 Tax=Mycobacterium kubicae TaxID=120959 RepID=UPI0024160DD0|nr:DUF4062 domain-containing protein [Mycobacterium kubicae]